MFSKTKNKKISRENKNDILYVSFKMIMSMTNLGDCFALANLLLI